MNVQLSAPFPIYSPIYSFSGALLGLLLKMLNKYNLGNWQVRIFFRYYGCDLLIVFRGRGASQHFKIFGVIFPRGRPHRPRLHSDLHSPLCTEHRLASGPEEIFAWL